MISSGAVMVVVVVLRPSYSKSKEGRRGAPVHGYWNVHDFSRQGPRVRVVAFQSAYRMDAKDDVTRFAAWLCRVAACADFHCTPQCQKPNQRFGKRVCERRMRLPRRAEFVLAQGWITAPVFADRRSRAVDEETLF